MCCHAAAAAKAAAAGGGGANAANPGGMVELPQIDDAKEAALYEVYRPAPAHHT